MTTVITEEQRAKRIQEIINEHIAKSKHRGDYHYNMAVQWGAIDDYIPGFDDGEEPYEKSNE